MVHIYATADDDFKRDAAAKLEAFITSKTPVEGIAAVTTSWLN